MNKENKNQSVFGMIGLGTMGSNLLQNIADHGYRCAGYDIDSKKVDTLNQLNRDSIQGFSDINDFIKNLNIPRIVMILVPAGKIVDGVIDELLGILDKGDIIIDGGNSHFIDTDRRYKDLKKKGYPFIGMGVSGGEEGARRGPSMMPGGDKKAYNTVEPILKKIAAHVNSEPTVAYMGARSAGHFVKMVHNGIEYGLMQLIAEAYHLLKQYAAMTNDELHTVFSKWNEGELHSYLIGITADIFMQKDELTDSRIIDKILDSAKQKGTGAWTSEDAMNLQVPIPVIDIAVSMRNLSACKNEREAAHQHLKDSKAKPTGDKNELVKWMEQALYFSIITVYAQGIAMLQVASKKYKYNLKLEDIAAVWRGGCIIRAALLEDIRSALSKQPDLSNLMLSAAFSKKLVQSQEGIRKVILTAVGSGIPVPAMMAALAYFDSYRSGWLPANLIQAQRDNFGAHTYERNDKKGTFHTHWDQKK